MNFYDLSYYYMPEDVKNVLDNKILVFENNQILFKQVYHTPTEKSEFLNCWISLYSVIKNNNVEQILLFNKFHIFIITVVFSSYPIRKLSNYWIFKDDFQDFLKNITTTQNFEWKKEGF